MPLKTRTLRAWSPILSSRGTSRRPTRRRRRCWRRRRVASAHVAHGQGGWQRLRRAGARLAICDSVGFVPQEALIVSGTIRENVLMGRPFDKRRFDWAIETAAMQRDLKILPHAEETVVGERGTTLSGGQQQRVAVARALANDPAVVLADEPTANLDLRTGTEIIELLREMNKDSGVTIISATHDHKMLSVSDRVVWVKDGQVDRVANREDLDIEVTHVEGE
mgnify:CR=1 FL=1